MTDRTVRILPPTKRRRSFRRRFLITLLLILLAPPAAHLTWLLHAQHRLDTTLRAIHAIGQPIYPDDFRTPVPPLGHNAVAELRAAADVATTWDNSAAEFERLRLNTPLTPKEAALLQRYTERRVEAFTRLEAALSMPAIHWPIDPNIPSIEKTHGLNEARTLANLLRADILLAHHQRDDARAIDRVSQALAVSDIVDHQPGVTPHLVALGIASMTARVAEDIAPDLDVTSPRGVTRPRLRSLIDRLLDDRRLRDGQRLALFCERKDLGLDATRELRPRPYGRRPADGISPLAVYALKPMFLADADLSTRLMTAILHAFDRSNDWPTFRDTTNLPTQFPGYDQHPYLHPVSSFVKPSPDTVRAHYRDLTDLRLAATALAVRCYTVDHAGQLPPTLDALVPTYLPAVPTDPMAPNNAPLRYSPNPADPIVYSIGLDTTDDGGSEYPNDDYLRRAVQRASGVGRLIAPPPQDINPATYFPSFDNDDDAPLDRWDRLDAVLHLARQPRYQPQGQLEWQSQPRRDTDPSPVPSLPRRS